MLNYTKQKRTLKQQSDLWPPCCITDFVDDYRTVKETGGDATKTPDAIDVTCTFISTVPDAGALNFAETCSPVF